LRDEPARHTAALAQWLESGEKSERPTSRIPELEALQRRAEHVDRNRGRFERDVRKAKATAAAGYRRAIDEAETARQELLDLRATEVWVSVFPSDTLLTAPPVLALAGARKAVQEPLFPGVKTALEAQKVFELMRQDARFCADVATVEQHAAIQGKTVAQLTGREATWQKAQTDLVGPDFPATWAGSPEEAVQAERQKVYRESLSKRLWGDVLSRRS
jgi:hypothetical protein